VQKVQTRLSGQERYSYHASKGQVAVSRARHLTIACICADLLPGHLGGAEHHVVEVIKRLGKHHHLYLFVGPDTSIKHQLPPQVDVIPIYYPKLPNLYGVSFIFFGFWQILWYLLNRPIDLIWAKQSFPQAPLGALIKIMFGKPLYITAQNPMLHQQELVVKGSLFSHLHHQLANLITPIISWSLSRADLVAAVSHYSGELAKNLGATNIHIVPNGVNLSPLPKVAKPKTFSIISCSSLIDRNGLDTLINAVYLLPQSLRWQLSIAGSGPEFNHLQAQINRLGISSQVKLLGSVDNHRIPKLLSDSHVFVRPSRREGFGVAFIEAMSFKLPVIATPVGGIVDFITDHHTGLLALPNDATSVARCLKALYKDKVLAKKLASNGYKLVKTKYTWDKISHQIESLWLKLCNSATG